MQGGATRRRVVSHFSTKIPLRRYFSGPAAVGYSLLFVSLLLTPYLTSQHGWYVTNTKRYPLPATRAASDQLKVLTLSTRNRQPAPPP